MKKLAIIVSMFLVAASSFAGSKLSQKEKAEITTMLNKQVEAWNNGDLDTFMDTYWHSEKLVFVGSRGPTYGWQATLDNYKKGYPDKKTMGHLEFKIFDISKIDKKTIFVIGRFELTRETGELNGHFTLIIQKIKGQWLIISDHSSAEG
jgi:hypothetical protein